MPQRQPKAAIERREQKLLIAYARAWARVVKLQEDIASDPKKWRQARKLREAQRAIEAILDDLDAQAQRWFSNEFPEIHALGVNAGAAELGIPAAAAWSTINQEAVAQLASEGFGDLLKATRSVRRTTKTLIRKILADEILQKMIAGDTAVAAARRARRIIERNGIYAVRYRDGSLHGLREYTNMAVRTKTAVAYNTGVLDSQTGQGIVYWEVFDGDCGWTSHDSRPTANGKIVTREEGLMYPIAHPACRRSFGARPDLNPLPVVKPPEPDVRVPSTVARERARARTERRVARRAR